MALVERPGTDLEQQRRHEEKIVLAHENDLHVRPVTAKLFQMAGRVDPAKTAAENHDPFGWGWGTCDRCHACPFILPVSRLP